jgi:hypothetical protein
MERDREISKLVNVLQSIARALQYVAWNNAPEDATTFCVAQYNRVLSRLREIEPAISELFTELPANAPAQVVRIATHELAAYFEDEAASPRRHRRRRHCRGVHVGVGVGTVC